MAAGGAQPEMGAEERELEYRKTHRGVFVVEEWTLDGKPHRLDGPSCIETEQTGGRIEHYWCHGRPRPASEGATRIMFGTDGSVSTEMWLDAHARNHREDGPAVIEHAQTLADGTTVDADECYYLDGIAYTADEHARELSRRRAATSLGHNDRAGTLADVLGRQRGGGR